MLQLDMDITYLEMIIGDLELGFLDPEINHLVPQMITKEVFLEEMKKLEIKLKAEGKKLAVSKKDIFKPG